MIEDDVVGRVFRGTDLLQDHMLLALQLLLVESRIDENVGEKIDGERHVVLEDAGIIGGRFDTGRGIELAADILDLFGDLAGTAPVGALEGHMLEEMGNAMLALGLVAGTGLDPDAERRAGKLRHGIGGDGKSVGKLRDFDAHAASAPFLARERRRT